MSKRPIKNRAHLSKEFGAALLGETRKYCEAVGIKQTTFEQWKTGITRPPKDDPRLYKLADMLGFPKEKVFDSVQFGRRSVL